MGGPAADRSALIAFLGPSLSAVEARRIVPDVLLRPPACQGDLTSAVRRHRPRAVLLVDGEFGQSLSVWHKEVLDALERGVRVLGSSSMGALRAAELERFGMEGVGAIFEHYRDGWLTNDADVALVHGSADDGYPGLTWPTVNVRATLRALEAAGRMAPSDAAAVEAVSSAIHFTARTRPVLARELVAAGHSPDHADGLASLVESHYVDQKARDARAGLRRLRRIDELPPPVRERPLHLANKGFEALSYSDVEVTRRPGALRAYQVVDDAALHEHDFEELLHRAVDRHLLMHLSLELDQHASADELERARTRLLARLGLGEDELPAWMDANDLDEELLDGLVGQLARLARLRRWMLDGVALEHNRRMVVEQLQLEGRYAAAADAAARRRRWADSRPEPPMPTTVNEVVDLVVHQKALSGWSPDRLLEDLADEQGFDSLGSLYVALADSRAASEVRQERLRRVNRTLGRFPRPQPGAAHRVQSLLEAHQVSHLLLAALDLGLPAALADGARTSEDVATEHGLHPGRLDRLLGGLAAVGVVRRVAREAGAAWELTEDGRLLVPARTGEPPSLSTYAAHIATLMGGWRTLADVVRGRAAPPDPGSEEADAHVAAASHVLGVTEAVLEGLALPRGAGVADFGGGLGHLVEALAARRPDVSTVLVERPDTAARARQRLAAAGLEADVQARIAVESVDPDDTTWTPAGRPVDVGIIVRVLVTLDDTGAVALLNLARRSLAPGGRLVVVEPELDGSPAAALSDLLNLARSDGAVRTPDGWRALAARAGLRTVAREPMVTPFVRFTLVPDERP